MLTFKKLNGVYPEKKTIREHVEPLKNIYHNDMKIFNLVIQGVTIHPIDCSEAGRNFDTIKQVDLILNCFRSRKAVDYEDDVDIAEDVASMYDDQYDFAWLDSEIV